MNWLGNGNTAQLWTLGLGIAAAIAVVSIIAAYLYSHRNRAVEEQHDLVREQRTRERLAQIAVPVPLSVLDGSPAVDEHQAVEEPQTAEEPQLMEEHQFVEEPLVEAPHFEDQHLIEERQTA
jgi:hypothetical protein